MPPPKKLRRTDEGMEKGAPDGVIRFEVDNFSTLDVTGRDSPVVEVGGVYWSVHVWNDDVLVIGLKCTNDQSTPWTIDVNAEFIVVHSNSSQNMSQEKSITFDHESDGGECDILFDPKKNKQGFIKDDKNTFEIRFWISNKKGIKYLPRFDFTDSSDPRHDVTLVIEGEKIYANKAILAANSPFFNSLFYGEFAEKNKEEIELKDVDREEFLEMLQVIYPSSKAIADDTAEYLLKLGDRFQIASLVDRVEKYLMEWNQSYNYYTLKLADQYNLFGLLEHRLSKLKTTKDFKDLEESPVYNDLSDATKAILFSRVLKVAK